MVQRCQYGKLKSPVHERGVTRRCKLVKKTHLGRVTDRVHKSREAHEVRYRSDKRLGKR